MSYIEVSNPALRAAMMRARNIPTAPKFKPAPPPSKPEPIKVKIRDAAADEIELLKKRILEVVERAKFKYPLPLQMMPDDQRIKVSVVLRAVATHFNVSVLDIKSQRRHKEIVRPRQVAMWFLKFVTLQSLPSIGRYLGGRDHTTVLYGINKIENLRHEDEGLAADLEHIKSALMPRDPHQVEESGDAANV